jgi:hypothetical protein
MKTIIKITKQEAMEAWKKQNPKVKYDSVEIEETLITLSGSTTIENGLGKNLVQVPGNTFPYFGATGPSTSGTTKNEK